MTTQRAGLNSASHKEYKWCALSIMTMDCSKLYLQIIEAIFTIQQGEMTFMQGTNMSDK